MYAQKKNEIQWFTTGNLFQLLCISLRGGGFRGKLKENREKEELSYAALAGTSAKLDTGTWFYGNMNDSGYLTQISGNMEFLKKEQQFKRESVC